MTSMKPRRRQPEQLTLEEARELSVSQRYRLRKQGVDVPILRRKWYYKKPEDFWSFVDKSAGENECWPWKAGKTGAGYGAYYIDMGTGWRIHLAHRIAKFYSTGEWPGAGSVCRHSCDNPPCCNPVHLCFGTQAENSQDMVRRGRCNIKNRPHGTALSFAKLNDEKVIQMRAAYKAGESQAKLSRRFGVATTTVWWVVTGRTWKHVNG